jgi:hypothetical protein
VSFFVEYDHAGMTGFKDGNGINVITYAANDVNSPVLEFSNLELGIINGSTLGGYFQIVNDPTNPNNVGKVVWGYQYHQRPGTFHACLLGLGHHATLVASSAHLN